MPNNNNSYVYSISRLRVKEMTLLDDGVISQLVASDDYDSMMRILADKGWNVESKEVGDITGKQTDELWSLIDELVDDKSQLSALKVEKDFHNLKAAIKAAYSDLDMEDYFVKYGTVETEIIKEAIEKKDFTMLPDFMRPYAEEAFDVLFKTGDGQKADSILDKGSLIATRDMAAKSDSTLLKDYANTKIDIANLKIAIRGSRTGKDKAYFEEYLVSTPNIDAKSLAGAAIISEESIYSYLEHTEYKDGIDKLEEGFASFESWCDNQIIKRIKLEKYNSFSISAIIAYIIAREMEIKNVGIVLVAKRNEFSAEEIKKRMRDMYV